MARQEERAESVSRGQGRAAGHPGDGGPRLFSPTDRRAGFFPAVFRARILSKRYVGSETRYDVQVQQTYRNRFPLRSREYVWVPNTCDCPHLLERREYLLMARNHVNFEQTLNRLLLQRGDYARPWSPREDLQLRDAAPRCQPGPPA